MAAPATPVPADKVQALRDDLKAWWDEVQAEEIILTPEDGAEDADLWDNMPVLDSKRVALSSHLFVKHLGVDLDMKLIRPGGYSSFDDFTNHIIPAMIAHVAAGKASKQKKSAEEDG
jgi:hypothetical protein